MDEINQTPVFSLESSGIFVTDFGGLFPAESISLVAAATFFLNELCGSAYFFEIIVIVFVSAAGLSASPVLITIEIMIIFLIVHRICTLLENSC